MKQGMLRAFFALTLGSAALGACGDDGGGNVDARPVTPIDGSTAIDAGPVTPIDGGTAIDAGPGGPTDGGTVDAGPTDGGTTTDASARS